jgi:hypothetical protein
MGRRLRRTDPEKERFWRRTMSEQGRSGLSIREFCSRRSVSEPLFYAWRRELARRDGRTMQRDGRVVHGRVVRKAPSPVAPQFVSLKLAAEPRTTMMIEIVTRSGHTLRVPPGVDRQTLSEVWALVEGGPC